MIDLVLYQSALWALWVVIATVFVQGMIAAAIKAKQPNAIPGQMPEGLDHHSIVFRTSRTHLNSLENLPVFLGTAIIAILAHANPTWTTLWIWLYAIARLAHMLLYYAIATNRNPSPRSYFYLLGVIANIALLVLIVITLCQV
ncbi:MAG: MAPEG family protein [Pseudomonadota bacterium]|nr:MAPEG family protein [Pseudomonadota bacterium]